MYDLDEFDSKLDDVLEDNIVVKARMDVLSVPFTIVVERDRQERVFGADSVAHYNARVFVGDSESIDSHVGTKSLSRHSDATDVLDGVVAIAADFALRENLGEHGVSLYATEVRDDEPDENNSDSTDSVLSNDEPIPPILSDELTTTTNSSPIDEGGIEWPTRDSGPDVSSDNVLSSTITTRRNNALTPPWVADG